MTINMPEEKRLTEIIELCKENDRKAQRTLYDLFSKKMFVVCLRYSSDYSDAEDMLQEGFIKIFKKIDKYNHSGSFPAWMSRLISNNCIDIIRKKPNLYAITEGHENTLETYNTNAIDKLIGEDIVNLIQSLPTGYRTIFNMYVVEGYSHKEIAEKLDISAGTSKSQLNRARKVLQKKLEEIKVYESLKISK
ncbi:MAG: RNA polymerase sigma factor [Chitinophagales bacterium]